jgi:hypothetical protein
MDTQGSRGNREAAEAGATQERTLEAVGYKPWFGADPDW